MSAPDFFAPAFADLTDDFFNEDTEIIEIDDESESGDEAPTVEDVEDDGAGDTGCLRSDSRMPDIVLSSQPSSRNSPEIIPDSQPLTSSAGSPIVNGSKKYG